MGRPKQSNSSGRGRAAWPELDVDGSKFDKWLGARAIEDGVQLEDLYLAYACLEQVPGAVDAFSAKMLRPALAALPESDRDDVGQRVLERLLTGSRPKLAEFEGRGSLSRWLRMVVLREARTERTVAKREAPLAAERLSDAFLPAPDAKLIKARSQALLKKALVSALLELDEGERKLLVMFHLEGIPHSEIGKAVAAPRSTVAWRLQQARQKVLENTKRQLLAAGLKAPEVESLFGIVNSHVDISLSALR